MRCLDVLRVAPVCLALVLLLLVIGCVPELPPGYSPGGRWVFPLVDPLSNGRLLTTVSIAGHGPYLFAIDPSTWDSYLDSDLIEQTGVWCCNGSRHAPTVEVPKVRIGDLTIDMVHMAVVPANALDDDGRRVCGALGRSIVGRSLIFGFDRERGVAWLITQHEFHPLVGESRHGWKSVSVNGVELNIVPDLGRSVSTLDPEVWDEAKLVKENGVRSFISNRAQRTKVGMLGRGMVTAVDLTRQVRFAPVSYMKDHPGSIGLDFFEPFSIEIDWSHEDVYIATRADLDSTRNVRLGRWGRLVPGCISHGCMRFLVNRTTLEVVPESIEADLEVVVRATKLGAKLADLEFNFAKGSASFRTELPPEYQGALLEVIDASPFPRKCPSGKACVMFEAYARN